MTSVIILVAALLFITLSYCSAEGVYCVTPTQPTVTSHSSCPPNSSHNATLSEYAQEAELYFTSNTTMVFLPGDHTLDMNIAVANVTRLTMHGVSSSDNIETIVRNGSVGFSFTNMVDFNVYGLAFTSCNRSWSCGSHPASDSVALFLQSTQYAKLVNCLFHDNHGTALVVKNTDHTTLAGNSTFINNQCGCKPFAERCELGCGITAFNSTLTFTGNTSFFKNRYSSFGISVVHAGAILARTSSLHFTGINNFFDNVNNADGSVGGAIHIADNAVLTFNGINNFIGNLANYGKGGAQFMQKPTSQCHSLEILILVIAWQNLVVQSMQ